jgi:addiction module HigA family antidote
MFAELTIVRPVSPGDVIRDRVLPKFSLTQDKLADLLGVSRFSVNQLCNHKRNMTPSMALRIAKVTGTTAEFWMNMQLAVDMFEARIKHEIELDALQSLALNFDVSAIANHAEVTTDPVDKNKWHPVTDKLIWMTMTVDVGELTEKTVDEFYWRMRLLQLFDGPNFQFVDGTDVYLTMEDLRDHIGLRTNVITIDRKKWLAKRAYEPFPVVPQEKSARVMLNELAAKLAKGKSDL